MPFKKREQQRKRFLKNYHITSCFVLNTTVDLRNRGRTGDRTKSDNPLFLSKKIHHEETSIMIYHRSSHRGCSIKKMFLKISQNSQENTCARVSFFSFFPVNFAKFFRKLFSQNASGRLLLFTITSLFVLIFAQRRKFFFACTNFHATAI